MLKKMFQKINRIISDIRWKYKEMMKPAVHKQLKAAMKDYDAERILALCKNHEEQGQDGPLTDENGLTPLHSAAFRPIQDPRRRQVQPEYTGFLRALARNLDVNMRDKYGDTSLHITAREGNRAAMEILLAAGAEPNDRRSEFVVFYGIRTLVSLNQGFMA